jgi:flagellar hook-associated protein 2
MSTSTSSLGIPTAATSVFAPITLTGVSQYSSDLQSVLNRAVAIAQIPITALQNSDATVLSKENLLGQLQTTVQALATSLSSLGAMASTRALSATSSDSSVVSATDTGAATPANYTINSVTSIAAAASEHSLASYSDSTTIPVSSTGNMALVVGSQTYQIALTGGANNLAGLAQQINLQNAGVTASVLTTAGADYLSLSASSTGATTLQIIDDPGGANTQWLTNTNQGADAEFHLNGIDVKQPSNTVNNVIPGLTFNILDTSDTPVTLSLASDPSQLTSALQTFVANYNSLRTALNAQEGPAAGALSGDTSVIQLEDAMRRLTAYTSSTPGSPNSGSIQSLSDLGITFSSNGQATLDPTVVSGLSDSQLSDALNFVGSATSGLGGLSQTFQQFSDPTDGLIRVEANGYAKTDQSLQSQISTLTSRMTIMQKNLASQLSIADAAIAELQSQQTELSASLQGLSLVLYGPSPTSA